MHQKLFLYYCFGSTAKNKLSSCLLPRFQLLEVSSLKVKVFCHARHVRGLHFETRADPEFMGAELYSRIRDAIPDLETFVQHTLIGGYSRSHLHVLYGTGPLLCYMAPDSSTCELLV